MDEGVSNEKLDQCLQMQSKLGLGVSVLKQGELGSYRDLTQKNNRAYNNAGITLEHARSISRIR